MYENQNRLGELQGKYTRNEVIVLEFNELCELMKNRGIMQH